MNADERIRYYTQDIVVFRGDMHQKMQRHALLPVASDEHIEMDDGDAEDIEVDDGVSAHSRGQSSSQGDVSKHVRRSRGGE